MDPTPEELEKRLEALEARAGVESALYRYREAADYGPPETWADCFTPSGTYEVQFPEGNIDSFTGTDQLAEFAVGLISHTLSRHFITAPDIEIEGDEATVTAFMGSFDAAPDAPGMRLLGRYFDRLVRCPDGRWRFVSRRSAISARRPAPPPNPQP